VVGAAGPRAPAARARPAVAGGRTGTEMIYAAGR
jgi:hypothetical protein